MDQKHLPGYFLHLFRETESDNIRKAGERTGITVSIAHSSAGQNVISQEFPLFCNSHEAQVLSVYIHIIFRGSVKAILNLRGKYPGPYKGSSSAPE